MVFVAALLVLDLLPHIRSVKVVIDGTIDFGPNWNFQYKLHPINNLEPRKTISDNPNVLLYNENVDTKAVERGNTAVPEEISNTGRHVAVSAQDDSSDGEVFTKNDFEVTKLYKIDVKKDLLFKKPRKIKDETEVIKFVDHIKNQSIKMFDDIREKIEDKTFVHKINELKERYANIFGKFENETMRHTIRTKLGNKKVILNTIEYSNKLLSRLINRFKIDTEDRGVRSGLETKIFQEHTDNLKNAAHEEACNIFNICRAGKEFSDHISDLITALLENEDGTVQLAVTAVAKALKKADFSRIMDDETHKAFTKGLSTLEELNPFELRVLLMAYKLLIDNRHQPFIETDPKDKWVKATVAMFHVMEGFNRKVIIDAKDWSKIKNDLNLWLSGEKIDVKDIAKNLVDHVQEKIAGLDNRTANDFKAKLRLCMAAKSLRISLSSYVQFQPFVI